MDFVLTESSKHETERKNRHLRSGKQRPRTELKLCGSSSTSSCRSSQEAK
jgi:hypothetical protein